MYFSRCVPLAVPGTCQVRSLHGLCARAGPPGAPVPRGTERLAGLFRGRPPASALSTSLITTSLPRHRSPVLLTASFPRAQGTHTTHDSFRLPVPSSAPSLLPAQCQQHRAGSSSACSLPHLRRPEGSMARGWPSTDTHSGTSGTSATRTTSWPMAFQEHLS